MLRIVSSNAWRAPSQNGRSCTESSTYALCDAYWTHRVEPSRQQRRQHCAIPRSSGFPFALICREDSGR